MVNVTTKSIFTNPNVFRKPSTNNNLTEYAMAKDLANRQYLRWDSEGVENVPAGEDDDIKAVAEQINKQQLGQFDLHRHVYTGTHCRTHGIVKGTFTVHDNLPDHLRQGELFSKPQTFPAACRYSTETGGPTGPGIPDNTPSPRGFAMKLFNVQGDFFDIGKDIPTQDIEFNSTPAIELATPKVTREIFDIRMEHGEDMDGIYKDLEQRDDEDLQKARYTVPIAHLASLRQYSQTAYRYGDYVFKYCLVPNTETQQKLSDQTIKPETHENDVLHKWLQNFHNNHDAEYLFQVQLLEKLDEQPVEYSGTEWDSQKYPWQTVATLRIPKQEAWDLERKSFWEDHMRLDSWHGLKAYQPLGGSNRLRKVVYPASSELRRKMNGRKEIWIKSIDEIPN